MSHIFRRRAPANSPNKSARRLFVTSGVTVVTTDILASIEFRGSATRSIIRRQLPPNAAGQVFRRRIFVGGQGATTVTTDIRAGIEVVANLRTDAFGGEESNLSSLIDSLAQTEYVSARRSDSISQIENIGLLLVSIDANGKIEFTSARATDIIGKIETSANLIIDKFAQVEALSALRGDFAESLENLAILRGDIGGALENTKLLQVDRLGGIESLLSRSADLAGQLENLGQTAIISNISTALEILSFIQNDNKGQTESLLMRRLDGGGTIEFIALSSITSNQLGAIEFLGATSIISSSLGGIEFTSTLSVVTNLLGVLEFIGATFSQSGLSIENLASARVDALALAEFLATKVADQRILLEILSSVSVDVRSQIEYLAIYRSDSLGSVETLLMRRVDAIGSIESQTQVISDGKGIFEFSGNLQSSFSGGGFIEFLASVISDEATSIETSIATFSIIGGSVEYGVGVRVDARSFVEILSSFLVESSGQIETLASVTISFDMLSQLEIAGFGIGFDCVLGLLESGILVRIDAGGQIENRAIITLDAGGLLEAGFVPADLSLTNLSIGRVRILTAPYTSLDLPPFDPMKAGEVDTFAFDFTPDVGSATIRSTTWNCAMLPGSTGFDDVSQARVIRASSATQLFTNSPLDNTVQTWNGTFSVAIIGAFPPTAIGGTYSLEATANLSDGRVLKATSTVLCTANNLNS